MFLKLEELALNFDLCLPGPTMDLAIREGLLDLLALVRLHVGHFGDAGHDAHHLGLLLGKGVHVVR